MDYTPTTEYVKAIYVNAIDRGIDECNAEFNRWLAEVKAQAWAEGVADRDRYDYPENPYR